MHPLSRAVLHGNVRSLVLLVLLAGWLLLPAAATAAPAVTQSEADSLTITLDASGSVADPGRTLVDYRWDFGDGTLGAGVRVEHRYPGPGVYAVTLMVTDDAGASSAGALAVAVRTIGFELSQRSVVWGSRVVVTGAVEPAEAGLEVAIEQARHGVWQELSRVQTDSGGRYALLVAPAASGRLRARLRAGGAVSAAVAVSVGPRVVLLPAKPGVAFVGVKLAGRVFPSSYSGRVRIAVRRGGAEVASLSVRARAGRLYALLPVPGIGRFTVVVKTSPREGLVSRRLVTQVRASLPGRLDVGARGSQLRGLVRRLLFLGFHLPGTRSVFGPPMRDAVTAFQTAAGLEATGVVTEKVWRALARARPLEPRYRRPALHLEVDLRRRLLVVVRDGRAAGILPISGSAPRGAFAIRSTTPALAADGFSIQALPGAGFVRVPLWAARWLISQTRVGERVYVY